MEIRFTSDNIRFVHLGDGPAPLHLFKPKKRYVFSTNPSDLEEEDPIFRDKDFLKKRTDYILQLNNSEEQNNENKPIEDFNDWANANNLFDEKTSENTNVENINGKDSEDNKVLILEEKVHELEQKLESLIELQFEQFCNELFVENTNKSIENNKNNDKYNKEYYKNNINIYSNNKFINIKLLNKSSKDEIYNYAFSILKSKIIHKILEKTAKKSKRHIKYEVSEP